MNNMQEAKEESGRSGLGSGYTSKAPVTVNTLHDQKNLMLVQLSQFSVSRPKSRLRKGQVQVQVAGTGLINKTNSQEKEKKVKLIPVPLYLPFVQNQPYMQTKK